MSTKYVVIIIGSGAGGGMSVGTGSRGKKPSPLIEGNRFENNTALTVGGGMILSHPGDGTLIQHNLFVHNKTIRGDGAAIFLHQGDPYSISIDHNTFVENTANDHGTK